MSDPLGEILHSLRISGALYCRSELSAPWGIEIPSSDHASFHVLLDTSCWLRLPDAEPQVLQPGELVLLPHGHGHKLSDTPTGPTRSINELAEEHELTTDHCGVLRHGGGGARTTMICGAVRFGHAVAHPLLPLLPPVIRVRPDQQETVDWLASTLSFMTQEARNIRPGGQTVIARLADVLVIQAIRFCLEAQPEVPTGWMAALRHPHIGRAINLMHRRPGADWTLDSLGSAVGMSRSSFAERFAELVGEPPMQYLTRWRMHLAASWLRDQELNLANIAERLGYRSEAAFSRAFKRATGLPPATWRRGAEAPDRIYLST